MSALTSNTSSKKISHLKARMGALNKVGKLSLKGKNPFSILKFLLTYSIKRGAFSSPSLRSSSSYFRVVLPTGPFLIPFLFSSWRIVLSKPYFFKMIFFFFFEGFTTSSSTGLKSSSFFSSSSQIYPL